MRYYLRIALLTCVLGTMACASSPGRLEANRFQHATYPYSLFYAQGGEAKTPLGPDYTLANFDSPDGRRLYPRSGPEFSVDRSYVDESPAQVGRESFYDLLFTRKEPKADFWVRSVPLRKAYRDTQLAQLAQQYLDAVALAGRVAAPFGLEDSPPRSTRGPQPAQLRNLQSQACELSKREALRIDFELENPGAVRTLDEPEWLYASVILVRTGYFARADYPVLMLVGRSSGEAKSALLERDFDQMLELLALGDRGQGLTMKGGHTCGHGNAGSGSERDPAATDPAPTPPAGSGGERTPELEVPIIQDEQAPPPAS